MPDRNDYAESELNIALLIDADNASPEHLDEVLLVLGELGTINIRRAYGNWTKGNLKGWEEKLLRHGIVPQQQFDVAKDKNATDMKMTIDAMDLLYSRRVTGFGLMTSDSDFAPLATRIREEGIPVYGFGEVAKTPASFQSACTRFLDVNALTIGSEDEKGKPPELKPIDEEVIGLLVQSYQQAKHDDTGFAHLGEVGARARNASSFEQANYGFKRLADMIKKIPGFEIDVREAGPYVRYTK